MGPHAARRGNGYHPPLTVSHRALLVEGSDIEFRRLIVRLLQIEERLRHARAYLGRQAGLTGPQYSLLMAVAYLQGETGIAVRSLARELRVTSAFITTESRRLIERGLLAKRQNPHDSRSTLVTVTPAGRRAIEGLVPEVRAVNDLFFGHLSRPAFVQAKRFLEQLIDGSRQALAHIAARESHGSSRAATRRARNGRAQAH
ncbi:MAG TPA: MarR family transcriptional regulator [Burkholderiales bacterium]|nr:MarR family transcriptional regulator [Burkholderiales bacterium]